MTVPSSSSKSGPYSGNGVATSFPYGFRALAATDLRVIYRNASGVETAWTLGTDYSVTGVSNLAGGAVVASVAPAAGTSVTILRDLSFLQETDLQNQGAYYAEVVEDALDRAAMRDQQQQEQINRSIRIPSSDNVAAGELPIATARAGKAMIFDSLGRFSVSTDAYNDQVANVAALASAAAASAGTASGAAGSAMTNAGAAMAASNASQAARDAAQTARDQAISIIGFDFGTLPSLFGGPLRLPRGTTAQNDAQTFGVGALTYDTTTGALRVHDGATAGGLRKFIPDGGAFKAATSFESALQIGADANSSALRLGSASMSIGRTVAGKTLDLYNAEGAASSGETAYRFVTGEGAIATLSHIGVFEAKSLSARKATFGTFEQATGAWMMANPRAGNSGRPAVLGFNAPSEVSGYWDRDSVGLYVDNYARPVGIGIANCTFTATRVTLGNALSPTLRAYLRVGMIIDTRHSPQKYSGFVTGWDTANGAWIDVSGWFKVVPQGSSTGGDASAGQVPSGPQTIDVNPQTKTWAVNANLWTDPSSQRGTGSIAELGFFNNRGHFNFVDEDTHTYGVDVVSIGTYAAGWGLSVRSTSAASRINIGAEVFGAKLGSFISSVDRLPAGTFPFYGFVSRADGGKAFGVNTVADVPVFSVDAVTGETRIGASDGYTRAGAAVGVTRNGFSITGGAAGSSATIAAYGADTDINALFQAKGAGITALGAAGNKLSFFGGANALKQTVNGSRGGNAALASLIAALAGYNLITDSTTA